MNTLDLVPSTSPIPTMTSTQLVSILLDENGQPKYEKKRINERIREMFAEKVDSALIVPSLDSRGYVTDYNLPELEATMFVAKWDIEFLETVVTYFVGNKPEALTVSVPVPMPPITSDMPEIVSNRLFEADLRVANLLFKGSQALLSANEATLAATGINTLKRFGALALVAPVKEQLLTASDIGKLIPGEPSARAVNRLLEEYGYATSSRDHKKRLVWDATDKGDEYAEYLDTGKYHSNGTPVKQLKWVRSIVEILLDREVQVH